MASIVATRAHRAVSSSSGPGSRRWQRVSAAVLAVLLLSSTSAWSQGPSADGKSYDFKPDACRSVVSRFEETFTYLRQLQGPKVAADLKEKLLPAKLEREILFRDGYCGLARYLHEKRLDR